MRILDYLTAFFAMFHCQHKFEKERINWQDTSPGSPGFIIMTCGKCGKIKKLRI